MSLKNKNEGYMLHVTPALKVIPKFSNLTYGDTDLIYLFK